MIIIYNIFYKYFIINYLNIKAKIKKIKRFLTCIKRYLRRLKDLLF